MERFVELAGCVNLRDLGGYAGLGGRLVRAGVVYRSDALGRASGADLAAAVTALGITTTIDLRNDHERERQGVIPAAVPGRHLHIPAIDQAANATRAPMRPAGDIGELYLGMLERGAAPFARCVEIVADGAHHGVAYFCSAGKDRTGVLSALLLGLLGVGVDEIVADYALTESVADEIEARTLVEDPEIRERIWDQLPPGVSRAWPESMERFCELVEATYGGFEQAAAAIGVPEETVARLRELLLVP